ncbi:hypothetical protein NL478_27400, partial [Klebsiella pneumoniae]|nr:hypothetical protein [Klebsiella pneumoniae]
PEDLLKTFLGGVAQVAAACLANSYPTVVSVPHMLLKGFKNLVAIAVESDIDFKEATTFKEYLKDPSKFAVAVAAPVESAAPAQ